MKTYFCVDIGGTTIKYGVVDEDGTFLFASEVPTCAKEIGGSGIMEKVKSMGEQCRKEFDFAGVCVSTAGMVDWENGSILYASSLIPQYTGVQVKEILETYFGVPCQVENDVNCAGLAECYSGAGKEAKIAVCLTVGTGIGGAIIMDRHVFHGANGKACEVGYMNLPGGNWQDLASTSALVANVRAQLKESNGSEQEVDGKWIFAKAKEGDQLCERAIDQMVDYLAMGIANLCYAVNPEIVVLGGGIMAQKEFLLPKLQQALQRHMIETFYKDTKITFASHGNRAGMLGAFYNFMDRNA